MTKPLDELIDLAPYCDTPALACRGTVYEVQRARGESDFIAASYAFNTRPAQRAGVPLTARQVHAFLDHGPAALGGQVPA